MAITSPELDWATYEKYVLDDYLKNGYITGAEGRGAWTDQLGLDLGGRYGTGIEGFDWSSFTVGKPTGDLDGMGMPTYAGNPNAEADRQAAIQKYLSDPNTIYTIKTDRINPDGSTSGGRTRSLVRYKRVGDKLVPVDQRDFERSSSTSDALKGLALMGGVVAGAGALGLTGAGSGAATGGTGLTLGGASGTGLAATPGTGLTLAGTTGTGAGLATGTGAGTIGAGIGSTIGGATASTLPSWLTSTGGKVLGNVGGKLLGGALLGGAAAGAASGGNVNAAGLQGTADKLGTIGNEQLDIARALYKDAQGRIGVNDQLFTQIIQNALNQQNTQAGRSDQLWNTYVSDFLPNAQKFAQTALNYDTPGRRAEEVAAARAAVETEGAMQRQAQQRALQRAGVNIAGGRALTLDNASRFNQTKLSTGAADAARRNVEATGLNLMNQAANIGQGIVGTSQQQAGQSLTAGNAATGALATRESTRNATLAPTQAFYGGATSATGAQGNVLNGVANIDARNQEAKNAGWAGLGNLAGTVLTAGKDTVIGDWLGSVLSDPKSKKVKGGVSGKKALADIEDAKVKKWTYKKGLGDGGTHVGRMAGKGDPMGPDGMRRIDVASELGKQHAAIQELAREVKAIKKTGRRTLAEA